jgi:hypothetical protein
MIPAINQASNTSPGDMSSSDIGAIFLKIPEPITAPITRETAAKRPRRFTRPDEWYSSFGSLMN